MRFVTFDRMGVAEPGVLLGDRVVSLKGAGFSTLLEVIGGGPDAMDRVLRWVDSAPAASIVPLAATRLRAPIPRPPKIICIGLNYRDHAAEGHATLPDVPTVFSKYPTAVIGPGDPIVLPANSTKPDYEAELAVVIGKGGRHIPEDRWSEHVFGYTIFNDVSARDFQNATSQWMMGKTFDTFAPFGPAITTASEVGDPHELDISLTLSGERLQHSNTREMIFRIPRLIEFLSSVFTLEPGDLIATGTPSGVGFSRRPRRWLVPGDVAVVRIDKLGELVNPVVAEGAA